MIKILDEYGANFEIKNNQMLSPLCLAARLGRNQVNF